jgi:hypothetical protein
LDSSFSFLDAHNRNVSYKITAKMNHHMITAPLPAEKRENSSGRVLPTNLVRQAVFIDQVRLLRELETCPTSRSLPSYNDLARVERDNHSLKRLVSRLLKSCLRYINFLHRSSEKDTKNPFRIEQLCSRVIKYRNAFLERFMRCVRQIRRFDGHRPQLWAKALRSPDLTATKVVISALSPGAYQGLMRNYGLPA